MSDPFQSKLDSIVNLSNRREAVLALADFYAGCTPPQRELIRRGWPFDRTWEPPELSTLAQSVSTLAPPQRRVRAVLVYLCIDNQRGGPREAQNALAVIYHSAAAVRLDADKLFIDAAKMGAPRVTQMIWDWLRKPVSQKSLRMYGWSQRHTPDGVVHEPMNESRG